MKLCINKSEFVNVHDDRYVDIRQGATTSLFCIPILNVRYKVCSQTNTRANSLKEINLQSEERKNEKKTKQEKAKATFSALKKKTEQNSHEIKSMLS